MKPHLAVITVCLATSLSFLGPVAYGQPVFASESTQPDAVPRYRIEVIAFAHQEFNPAEEVFELEPASIDSRRRPLPSERRYVDELMKLALRQQIDGPIPIPATERSLPPYSTNVLALDYFSEDVAASGLEYELVPKHSLTLASESGVVSRLSAYRPLIHGAWIQDALTEEESVAFDIGNLGSASLRGTLRLFVNRFLHMAVDLKYQPSRETQSADSETNINSPPPGSSDFFNPFAAAPLPLSRSSVLEEIRMPPRYRLRAQRRILREELAYLDHPAFGLLILITLEPEDEPDTSALGIPPGPAA